MRTNKNLGFTRSHHFVLSYQNRLTENLLLKIEPYYQQLFDVPVEQRTSTYSALNMGAAFGPSDHDSLVNGGTGHNMGVELTLERYFNKGYYFLLTTSLFDSKYKGSDKVERKTAFNTQYVLNVLGGKEFRFGSNNILSANIKTSLVGGKYITPLNLAASRAKGSAVYDENRAYSLRQSTYFRTDIRFSYRRKCAGARWSFRWICRT